LQHCLPWLLLLLAAPSRWLAPLLLFLRLLLLLLAKAQALRLHLCRR
jgi:hypothetical protein